MNDIADVIETPLRLNELEETRLFRHHTLKIVTLWSASSLTIRHWRTGLEFTNPLEVGSNPAAHPAPDVVSQSLPSGKYGGISVDMFQPRAHQNHVPSGDDDDTNLYAFSTNSRTANRFSCPIELKVSVKVEDVLELILDERRQYYKFNPRGSGCLYWQLQLLHAFVAKKWIDKESLDAAIAKVTELAVRQSSAVPYPFVEGTFY